ncbi:MAG: sigma-70 family RNA polymerase sigma factor, partial [Candidatus Scalindua sp.]
TFAYPRIQGAMLDYLRETGLKKKWVAFHGVAVFHLDDEFDCPDKKADALLKAVDDRDSFDSLISGLEPDQKIVMTKAYAEDLKQREIAKELNVSESWISRLKITSLGKIRRAE